MFINNLYIYKKVKKKKKAVIGYRILYGYSLIISDTIIVMM